LSRRTESSVRGGPTDIGGEETSIRPSGFGGWGKARQEGGHGSLSRGSYGGSVHSTKKRPLEKRAITMGHGHCIGGTGEETSLCYVITGGIRQHKFISKMHVLRPFPPGLKKKLPRNKSGLLAKLGNKKWLSG